MEDMPGGKYIPAGLARIAALAKRLLRGEDRSEVGVNLRDSQRA